MMKMWCVLLAMVFLSISCAAAEDAQGSWLASVLGEDRAKALTDGLDAQIQRKDIYAALIYIVGEVSEYSREYDHVGTLNKIDDLIEDEKNAAIILYMNTPGGSLYEADELYHRLMTYKKETGRPVYAYMAQECCSAGVYVAMAADRIAAARMSLTGSVGVYMSTYSQAGLFEKLGIETEYIVTGENKIAGYPKLTDAQREIYQSLVDEGFESFKEAIAHARNLSDEQIAAFEDGRLLTARQAEAAGLIDEVVYYDEWIDSILEGLGGNAAVRDVTPPVNGMGFDGEQLLNWLIRMAPQADEQPGNGVSGLHLGGLRS